MAALDEASRTHEEYRLRLDAEKEIRLAGLDVQRQVAEAQATVLATGLENADIDIVGGESVFFDRLVSSVSLGKAVDGFVGNSQTAQALARVSWLDGSSSFTDDLSRVLGSVSTGDVQNLTVSALLMRLMGSSGAASGQVEQLLAAARGTGARGSAGVLGIRYEGCSRGGVAERGRGEGVAPGSGAGHRCGPPAPPQPVRRSRTEPLARGAGRSGCASHGVGAPGPGPPGGAGPPGQGFRPQAPDRLDIRAAPHAGSRPTSPKVPSSNAGRAGVPGTPAHHETRREPYAWTATSPTPPPSPRAPRAAARAMWTPVPTRCCGDGSRHRPASSYGAPRRSTPAGRRSSARPDCGSWPPSRCAPSTPPSRVTSSPWAASSSSGSSGGRGPGARPGSTTSSSSGTPKETARRPRTAAPSSTTTGSGASSPPSTATSATPDSSVCAGRAASSGRLPYGRERRGHPRAALVPGRGRLARGVPGRAGRARPCVPRLPRLRLDRRRARGTPPRPPPAHRHRQGRRPLRRHARRHPDRQGHRRHRVAGRDLRGARRRAVAVAGRRRRRVRGGRAADAAARAAVQGDRLAASRLQLPALQRRAARRHRAVLPPPPRGPGDHLPRRLLPHHRHRRRPSTPPRS